MKPSLNHLVSLILSGVTSGLHGVANHAISRKTVLRDVITTRGRLAEQFYAQGKYQPEAWASRSANIRMAKVKANTLVSSLTGDALVCTIPAPLLLAPVRPVRHAVLFVGSQEQSYHLLEGNAPVAMRWSLVKNAPSVYIKGDRLMGFNLDSEVDTITLEWVAANPRDGFLDASENLLADPLPGFEFGDEEPWPMPVEASDMMTGKLIDSYVRYYRTSNPQPNTQAEINAPAQTTNRSSR